MGPLAIEHVLSFVQYCDQNFPRRVVADGLSMTTEEYKAYMSQAEREECDGNRVDHRSELFKKSGKTYAEYYGYQKIARKGENVTFHGVTRTYDEWAARFKMDERNLRCRVARKGVDEAFSKILRDLGEEAMR
jgi:hypothetical protein